MHKRPALALAAAGVVAIAVLATGAALTGGSAGAVDRGSATHLGSFTWRMNAGWFGGFSGLELSQDGRRMTVLGDRATLLTAEITRDGGRITDIRPGPAVKLLSSRGKVLRGRAGDSEGLALSPDGTLNVSFEGVHRVARYRRAGDRAVVLDRPRAFRSLAANGSFEALAIDRAGRLYTMPESNRTAQGRIPVYRWDGRRWTQPFDLPARDRFLPVGADFGPGGRLYVLERATGFLGFRTRLRRFRIAPSGIAGEEILLTTATGTHDNLEGVSIWRDGAGRLRATMISDDNFLALQRTELVEYRLPD